jgi:hypothetical protein
MAVGCVHPTRPAPPPPTTGAEETGLEASTGDTAAPEVRDRTPLPPSVRIVCGDGVVGDPFVILPHRETEDSLLFVGTYGCTAPNSYGELYAMAIPGDIPNGTHDFRDLWDGVSGFDSPLPTFNIVAGDMNVDGFVDLWTAERLYLGPFLGRTVRVGVDQVATFIGDPSVEGSVSREYAVAGDFDADGDGFLDVITQTTYGMRGFVRYGPFSGDIDSADWGVADPATYSSLGEWGGCPSGGNNQRASWLRGYGDQGQDLVAVGSDPSGECSNDTYLWDPHVPRGTHLRYDQAIATTNYFGTATEFSGVMDPGDVDRDGHPDLMIVQDAFATIKAGPISGYYNWADSSLNAMSPAEGNFSRAIGDLSGDGEPDLIGIWASEDTPSGGTPGYYGTLVVLMSPFEDPVDTSRGVILGNFDWHQWTVGNQWADLDGDGLADLFDADELVDRAFRIWYGKDIKAAWERQLAEEQGG